MKKYLLLFSVTILILIFYFYGNEYSQAQKKELERANQITLPSLQIPPSSSLPEIPTSPLAEEKNNAIPEISTLDNLENNNDADTITTSSRDKNKDTNADDDTEEIKYDDGKSSREITKKFKSYVDNSSQLKIAPETEEVKVENYKYGNQIHNLAAEYYKLAESAMNHKISMAEYAEKDEKIRNSLIKIASSHVSLAAFQISEDYRMSGFFVHEDNVIDSLAWGMIATKMGHPYAADSCHNFVRKCTEDDFIKALDRAIFYADAYGLMSN